MKMTHDDMVERRRIDRRQGEKEFHVQAKRLAESQRIAHIGSWEHNLETNQAVWSDELFRLLGFDPEQDAEDFDLFFSMVHPDDQPLLKQAIETALLQQTPFSIDYRFLRKDGERKIIRAKAELVPDSAGKLVLLSGTGQDITEQKLAEEKIRKSESRLRESQEVAKIGSWSWDVERDTLEWSDETFRRFDQDPATFTPSVAYFIDRIHPDDRGGVSQAIEDSLACDQPYHITPRIKNENGREWVLEGFGRVERDAVGKPLRFAGTAQDITQRIEAERSVIEKNRFIESLVNLSPDILYIYDLKARCNIYSNHGIQHVLGYSVDEIQAMGDEVIPALMHPDDFTEYGEKILARYASAADGDHISHHYRMRHRHGDWRWLESHETIYQWNPDGTPQQIFGVCRDITERKQVEERIRQSEEFIRCIHDTVEDGFIVLDRDFTIISANRGYCQQVGKSMDQIIGRPCFEISHQKSTPCYEAGEECAVKEVFEFGEPRVIMHKHQSPDGVLYVETKAFPLKDGSGAITAAIEVHRNVTERHLLEAEQLKTQKLEAIGILAGGIAHDFNNLLQGVFGYVSLAKMALEQPEKVRARLEQAEKALSLSMNLTTQLLTFAKGGAPVKKRVEMKPVIENATKFALSGSRCDYRLHLVPNLWQAEVDEGQLSQVIQNIVLNASEAMPVGGTIDISAENIIEPQAGRQIRIAIKDTGIGIPEIYRAKIFDPYFTTKQKGSGLGLATSYSIMKNHGGSIDLVSGQNEGTTFFIILPACGAKMQKEESLQPIFDGQKQKRRILLMDDEQMVREVAQSMLEMLGDEVELACHGEEAIGKYQGALLSGNPFDLVILDLTIKGGMGGEETIGKLRAIDPEVRAVVSSGYADNSVVAAHWQYGFQGVLNKPYDIESLRACLDTIGE